MVGELGRAAYDDWIRDKYPGQDQKWRLRFVAVENSTVESDRQGSGIEELEQAVIDAGEVVLERREDIPVRWIGFIEHLENVTRRDVGLINHM